MTARPDDPIGTAWRSTPHDADSQTPPLLDTIAAVQQAHRKDHRVLVWLNFQEGLPCLAIIGLLANSVRTARYPWLIWAAIVLVTTVGSYLVATSTRHAREDRRFGSNIRETLARRLGQVEHRARLYRTIGWWYLAPLSIAIVLVRFATADRSGSDVVFFTIVAAVAAAIFVANRRVGSRRYEPEVEALRQMLTELDGTDKSEGLPT